MSKHLLLLFHSLALCSGLISFSLLFFLLRKYRLKVLKAYAVFFTSLSLIIFCQVVDTYIMTNIGYQLTPFQFLLGFFSNVADCLMIFVVPYFTHEFFELSNKNKRNRFFFVVMVCIFCLFYIAFGLVYKQLISGELFRIAIGVCASIQVLTVGYVMCLIARHYRHLSGEFIEKKKKLIKVMGIVTLIFLPGFIADIFWLELQFIHSIIPKGLYFTSLFYLIWNIIFIKLAYPYAITSRPTQHAVQAFVEQYRLTEREQDIVSLLLNGLSNKDIARSLYIEESTVKRHIQNIFQKTGAKSRFDLIQSIS